MPTGPNNLFLMQYIDGCIFLFQSGSCSVNRTISELKELGYSGMVACGINQNQIPAGSFQIVPARYIRGTNLKKIQRDVQDPTGKDQYCMAQAGENGLNRSLLTLSGVHALCDLHIAPKNAFDRFCAQLAAERNIAIDIRVRPLWELRGVSRERVIRVYEELLLLQNRYEFPLTISTGALTPYDMRSVRAVKMLLAEIGMDMDLICRSFSSVPSLLVKNRSVQEISE
ncbi:MAG TPA: RNase P subunit p30 family protein [Methanospirillum sp.]|uniref:RNase P subunit p30 family protein n=1 Tax=Methanospirillum sp. TaxID=45200 RepID=UPI002B61DD13|nr:RNase P subunit p30 family protein [Methanospirillum sp.]HWQ64354.1 RNase P subunit p30 family protein [Methanospirillum sp.]